MSLFEIDLTHAIESRFGHFARTMPVIIFEEYRKLLDYLYDFLRHAHNKILFDTINNKSVAYLKSQDTGSIRLRLNESDLHILNNLQKRVKIGKVGDYSIYFDIHSPKIITVDYTKKVLEDPLESDAVLYENYRHAFLQIERLGKIAKVEISSIDGRIEITLQNNTNHYISPDHQHYPELLEIFSGTPEIGKVVTDPLMYSEPIGYFNGRTGKPLSVLSHVLTTIDPLAAEAISLSKYDLTVKSNVDEKAGTEPIIVSKEEGDVVIFPEQQLHHYLLELERNRPITVGKCEGNFHVYFSWRSGPMVKSNVRSDRSIYSELDTVINIREWLQPNLHLYYDASTPDFVAIISPLEKNKKLQVLKTNHHLFPIFQKLAVGYVGIIPVAEGADEVYTVVYNEERGLVFDKQQSSSLGQALDSLQSFHFVIDVDSIATPSVKYTGLSKSQLKKRARRQADLENSKKTKRKTKKEKRAAERKNLPKK